MFLLEIKPNQSRKHGGSETRKNTINVFNSVLPVILCFRDKNFQLSQ